MTDVVKPLRSIRSYVRRESRITPAQRHALEELWPRYGVE
ncbi:MAG: tRNA (guanosine(46)-N7)-methyltransferase TrmB, partial [Gammaproteobacteria bacterium]|nr:tRNA (guanosine(46)-N7)-methyltransferase TrmB [Gammaproteobacteria bacterium]